MKLLSLCPFCWCGGRDISSHLTQIPLLGVSAKKYYLSSKQKTLLTKLSSSRTWSSLLRPLVLACSPKILVSQTDGWVENNEETGSRAEKGTTILCYSLLTSNGSTCFKPQNVIFMLSLDIRITALHELLCVSNKYDIYRLLSLTIYLLFPTLTTLKITLSDGISARRLPKSMKLQ